MIGSHDGRRAVPKPVGSIGLPHQEQIGHLPPVCVLDLTAKVPSLLIYCLPDCGLCDELLLSVSAIFLLVVPLSFDVLLYIRPSSPSTIVLEAPEHISLLCN